MAGFASCLAAWMLVYLPSGLARTGTVDPPSNTATARDSSSGEGDGLLAAKVAEEGDGDLKRALDLYAAAIRDFDRRRRGAAEALYRFAEVSRKLDSKIAARDAYLRVVEEFGGIRDLSDASRQRLAEMGYETGHIPPKPPDASSEGVIPDTEAGSKRSDEVDSASAGWALRSDNPGAAVADAGPGKLSSTRIVAAELAAPAPPSGGGIDLDQAEVNDLRADAVQLSARLRKISRELRILTAVSPDRLTVQLVDDPRLTAWIEARDRLLALPEVDLGPSDLSHERKVALERAIERRHEQFARYVHEIHLPRLQVAEQVLTRELDLVRVEIEQRQERSNAERARRAGTAPGSANTR